MHKLSALLPLLGWFYLLLGGYAALRVCTRGKLQSFFDVCMFGFIVVMSAPFIWNSITFETAQYQTSMKSFWVPFEQKIAHEAGEYYDLYYGAFHPHVKQGDVVNILGVSTREYHYARMYMYPAFLLQVDALPQGEFTAIVNKENMKMYPHTRVRAQYGGKYLIDVGGQQ